MRVGESLVGDGGNKNVRITKSVLITVIIGVYYMQLITVIIGVYFVQLITGNYWCVLCTTNYGNHWCVLCTTNYGNHCCVLYTQVTEQLVVGKNIDICK